MTSSFDEMLSNHELGGDSELDLELPSAFQQRRAVERAERAERLDREAREAGGPTVVDQALIKDQLDLRDEEALEDRDDREAAHGEALEEERSHVTEEREAQRGGSSGGGSSGGSSAASGPDAAPQLNGPDDEGPSEPDEDSEEVEEEASVPLLIVRGERERLASREEPSSDTTPEPSPEPSTALVAVTPERTLVRPERDSDLPEAADDEFRKGVPFGHSSEDVQLKRYPKELVDRLRTMIDGHLGRAFAQEMSAPQLVAAFQVASMGIAFDMDENTRKAVLAFKEMEPKLSVIENKTTATDEKMELVLNEMKAMRTSNRELATSMFSIELVAHYNMISRILGTSTVGLHESSLPVDDPRVLTSVTNVRKRAQEQNRLAIEAAGRRMQ